MAATSTPVKTKPVRALNIGAPVTMPDVFKGRVNMAALRTSGPQTTSAIIGEQYAWVDLAAITESSPVQSRVVTFDPEADAEDRALLTSLKKDGQQEPVMLETIADVQPPQYRIKDGHRRIAALRLLGEKRVKAIVAQEGSLKADLLTLTANVRKNLTPLETGRAVSRLRERHGLTTTEIAEHTGLTCQYVRLLTQLEKIHPALMSEVEQRHLNAKAAVALGQAAAEHQPALAQLAAQYELSEAEARRLVQKIADGQAVVQAALELGLAGYGAPANADGKEEKFASVSASDAPAAPARRKSSTGRRPEKAVTLESAAAVLRALFPEADARSIRSLAEQASRANASLRAVKLAGAFLLTGATPANALDTARAIEADLAGRKAEAFLNLQVEINDLIERGRFSQAGAAIVAALAKRVGKTRPQPKRGE